MKTLDIRERCAHCGKLIRGQIALNNWKHYAPYCSFAHQEYARMNRTLAAVQAQRQPSGETEGL